MRTVLEAVEEHSASITRDRLVQLAERLTAKTGLEHKLYRTPQGVAVYPVTVGRSLGHPEA